MRDSAKEIGQKKEWGEGVGQNLEKGVSSIRSLHKIGAS